MTDIRFCNAKTYLHYNHAKVNSTVTCPISGNLGIFETCFGVSFSAIWLNERLSSIQFVGTAFILGGAAFGEFYSNKRS